VKILDSDHCVAILRGRLDLTSKSLPDEELATTAISVGELAHGAAKSQSATNNLARLDVLLAALIVLPFDEWSARRFGWLKADLETRGEMLSDLDLQIASIALERESLLLTHNTKHFSRLVDLAGLTLDDWMA
jgi:tRNA(fMet)-specific endonuclease VapC